MKKSEINQNYNIPQSFYNVIEPYVVGSDRRRVDSKEALFIIWNSALTARDEFPEYSEAIAEWALSSVATSPLLVNPRFEEIHDLFGQAEIKTVNDDKHWQQLRILIKEEFRD